MSKNFYGTPFEMEEIPAPKFPTWFFALKNILHPTAKKQQTFGLIQSIYKAMFICNSKKVMWLH